ncbi:hypothetical protein SAMN06265377_1975 [Flagellimonas pacifica]|uniref:Uncharacterized protein n=1 Tax=Flagellimonas pacifica TaxID=1247520 RepID=A0A285MWH0_9FLAO|nr:hypothetical protein SAMN06265377_1975 [Allomuricauda parva]
MNLDLFPSVYLLGNFGPLGIRVSFLHIVHRTYWFLRAQTSTFEIKKYGQKKSPICVPTVELVPVSFLSFALRKSNQERAIKLGESNAVALFIQIKTYGSDNHYHRGPE